MRGGKSERVEKARRGKEFCELTRTTGTREVQVVGGVPGIITTRAQSNNSELEKLQTTNE